MKKLKLMRISETNGEELLHVNMFEFEKIVLQ